MREVIRSTAIARPALVYTSSATALAFAALTPTPSLVPLVALLATIRLAGLTFVNRRSGYLHAIIQAVFVALASAAIHLAPSLDALSTPNISLGVLSVITFFASCFATATVFAGCYAVRFTSSSWAQLTIFPALWASAWGSMASVSPVGQLVTWSPVLGLGPYSWLRPILGQWGIDWVTAAWAVIFSETIGNWIVGVSDEEGSPLDERSLLADHASPRDYRTVGGAVTTKPPLGSSARAKSVFALAISLFGLTLPSYVYPFLPLPLNSGTIVTPVALGCVMPTVPFARHGEALTLDDYIKATMQLQSVPARTTGTVLLLWPESAVSFASSARKSAAFAEIQATLNGGVYTGVSFEEVVSGDSDNARATKRNGLAIISREGTILEYYKRNLVPSTYTDFLYSDSAPADLLRLQSSCRIFRYGPRQRRP